ncbi:unnamed protein product [Macrosiphum euphorbiae]|uniref:Chromo domain-containing protein n=1 Tax=Macrosiphum euphorbiae TaxID=13131 RepID=A0AAV0X1Z9_9HEMI|nr:unnamed protein product [Macrosiphum euphorbiae]
MSVRENDNTTTPNSETKIMEEILGVTKFDENLTFLVKWANIEEPQIILAEQLNLLYPQKVIKYYEARLRFD